MAILILHMVVASRRQSGCSYMRVSPRWGPREGGDYIAILMTPHDRHTEQAGVM